MKIKFEIKTDPTAYIINSDALGDIVACLASLKYAIERYHTHGQYLVYILSDFKDLLFFVPKDKIRFLERDQIENSYTQVLLNVHSSGQRLHPLRLSLSDYSSLSFMTRVLPTRNLSYPELPLNNVDVSKFNIDFSRSVVIPPLYKDNNRCLSKDTLKGICDYLNSVGLIPVLIGKSSKMYRCPDFSYLVNAVNLIDKTSLLESAKIISLCSLVVGVDSGVIHLAGMTKTKIVSGYTYASPELRMPIREGKCGHSLIKVIPNIPCQFCQDRWQLESYCFSKCYYGTNLCVKKLTAKKFISAIRRSLGS